MVPNYISQGIIKAKLMRLRISCLRAIRASTHPDVPPAYMKSSTDCADRATKLVSGSKTMRHVISRDQQLPKFQDVVCPQADGVDIVF